VELSKRTRGLDHPVTRHVGVEEQDIGLQGLHGLEDLGRIRHLAHDLDVGLRLEKGADGGPDHVVVFGE